FAVRALLVRVVRLGLFAVRALLVRVVRPALCALRSVLVRVVRPGERALGDLAVHVRVQLPPRGRGAAELDAARRFAADLVAEATQNAVDDALRCADRCAAVLLHLQRDGGTAAAIAGDAKVCGSDGTALGV